MKILSWNTRGLGDKTKRMVVKRSIKRLNPNLVLIQETKKDIIDLVLVKELWSYKDIGWSFVEAIGRSGGILTMWDESKISVAQVLKGGYSLTVKCLTINKKSFWITNVYRPNDYRERKHLWAELQSLAAYCVEAWCIGGDFNVIRRIQERLPQGRVIRGMRKFNNFITLAQLMEIPLSNGKFTWPREGNVTSRTLLDRFLISSSWDDSFANTRVTR